MAQATVVYSNVARAGGAQGNLFNGTKFWFSHNVPQRSWFVAQVEVRTHTNAERIRQEHVDADIPQSNGGQVVKDEKEADVKLVDHKKSPFPPNT